MNRPTNPSEINYTEKGYWDGTYSEDYPSLEFGEFTLSHLVSGTSHGGTYWDGFTVSINGEDTNYFDEDIEGSFISEHWGCMAKDEGFSYYHNWYRQGDKQRTGTIGYRSGKFSMRWENDILAQDGDRFRSNATEVGWGNYFIGTNVYTTDPGDYEDRDFTNNGSKIFNNKNGTYTKGLQLSSPLYVGKRSKYGIQRIGYNHPAFGDFFQNGFHHLKLPFIVWGFPAMGSANFKLGAYSSPFYQSGRYSPNSLY